MSLVASCGQRTTAGDLLLPAEKNKAKEPVFVDIEFRQKEGAEVCAAATEGKFAMIAAPAGGPVAKLERGGAPTAPGAQAETVELAFPATQFKNIEKWTGAAYKVEGIEFQLVNEKSHVLQTLEIEGVIMMSMTGKLFGWTNK